MQGPDRNTPSDGALAASEPAGDRTAETGAPGAENSSPLNSPAAPQTAPAAESETPQAASISAAEPEKGSAGRRAGFFSRLAARLGGDAGGSGVRGASGVRKLLAVAGGVAAILGAVVLAATAAAPRFFGQATSPESPRVGAASLGGAFSGMGGVVDGGLSLFGDPHPPEAGVVEAADAAAPDAAVHPSMWRVAQLADDPSVTLVDVPLAHRPLTAALAATRVPKPEAQRLISSIDDVHVIDHFGPKDALTVAVDKATGHVVAYELSESPADVWQGRDEPQTDGAPKLIGKKLRLEIERVRVRKAVLVGADLHASFVDAGLGPTDDLLPMLDDALDGHAELSDIRPGARLRVVGTQDQVDGVFVRWVSLEAVEYFPANSGAPSVRVYRFGDEDDTDGQDPRSEVGKHGAESKHRRGWYDAKGRQPLHGGWRTPVPLARITSRFNPHRMHPVLHVIMPHNGVDFAAPVGTPVYATAAGVVTSAGNAGPCGNRIEIAHAGNIESIYCHLSRFVTGLRVGMHVEQRQLIAYVGQTGRVTGPHLHFGIRRNGVVIDPMTLRLDGMRVVSRGQRDEFDRRRNELDAELDGVALPAATAGSAPPPEVPDQGDSFYEEP